MKAGKLAPPFAEALTKAGSPAAVDTVDLTHGQINSRIGMIGDSMTALIMRLHQGENVRGFPKRLGEDWRLRMKDEG